MNSDERRSRSLHAYYDGELSRFARWRMDRKLRRSPELRRELAEWTELSSCIQEVESTDTLHGTRDTWLEIGSALSKIDREIESSPGVDRAGPVHSSKSGVGWNWGPLAASCALAVLALAVLSADTEDVILRSSTPATSSETPSGSLRYLKTNGVSYVVARDTGDVTIIWLMDSGGAPEGV